MWATPAPGPTCSEGCTLQSMSEEPIPPKPSPIQWTSPAYCKPFTDSIKRQSEEGQVKEYIRSKQISNIEKEYEERIAIFQTSPMDDSDVGIWHQYLDFAEKEGDHEKVVELYERCLIPCAAHADIWMRYVEFLGDANMIPDASAALSRALKSVEREALLEICCFSARYKERIGDIPGARQQYHEIYSKLNPSSHEAIEAHANFEHRLGDDEKAYSVYEEAIAAERKLGKVSDLPALLFQYAFFAYAVLNNPTKSRQILNELHSHNLTHPVIKGVIDLVSCFPGSKDMLFREFLDPLVQKYLLSDLNDGGVSTKSERREISLVYLDCSDKFGDINSIFGALERHISLFREGPSFKN